MDDNTRDVLSTAVTAIATLVGVAIGAVATWLLERGRRQREDRFRDEDLEGRRREHWLDRRRDLYAALLGVAFQLQVMARIEKNGAPFDHVRYVELVNGAFSSLAEIRLVTPAVYSPARALLAAATHLSENTDTEKWDDAIKELGAATEAFVAAAQANLG